LLAEGDEHKRQRRTLMPAFAFRHVKDLYPVFWSKSREMVDTIMQHLNANPQENNVVEIREWASRATLDIIGVAGMGQDFCALANPDSELNVTYRTLFSPDKKLIVAIMQLASMFVPSWFLRLLPMKRNDELRTSVATIKRVARDLVTSKRAQLEKGGRTDVDILSVAIESGGFSDNDLVNQLMTFLAAGHETTASALTWAVYLLCKHPEAQKRLREEIHAALPELLSNPDFHVQSTDIDGLAYLSAVINETSRIFPPVPLTLRETAHATTIQGHHIPANTTVIICPWATNTSTELWGPDAKSFNPDRWMGSGRANTGGAESNFAVTTFLHGPRSCIGMAFAKGEFACLVAAMVGRFEMELEDSAWELKIQGGITARPRGGLRVKLRAVEGSY
jgi:cytochrome P450